MRRAVIGTTAAIILVTGCSGSEPSPSTTEALRTDLTVVTTTAVPDARLSALETRLAELNVDRLVAYYDRDAELLRSVHVNQSFYESDLRGFDAGGLAQTAYPDAAEIPYEITELLLDREDCVVAATRIDLTAVMSVSDPEEQIEVMWPDDDGTLKLAAIYPPGTPDADWQHFCDQAVRGLSP